MTLYVAIISFVGVLVSAFVAYITSVVVQRNNFKFDYYKTVLNKRIEAYQYIDTQLMQLRTMAINEDNKPYHIIFDGNGKSFFEFQDKLSQAAVRSIWFSEDMVKAASKMSGLFLEISDHISGDANNNILIGKQYFDKIKKAQREVSKILVKDTGNLHDIKCFLKAKRKAYRNN